MNSSLLCLIPLAGWLAVNASAQEQGTPIPATQSQGMLAGHPFGLQLADGDTQNPADPRLRIRTPRLETGTIVNWSTAYGPAGQGYPNYSPEALFGRWVIDPNTTTWSENDASHVPELGGMSSGSDVTPAVDAQGQIVLGEPGATWYIFSLTVDGEARGADESLIEELFTTPNETPAGHILSYGVEGSTEVRQEFIDTNRFEYTREQVGLLSPLQGDTDMITALDWNMGRISVTPNGGTSVMLQVRDRFYFSVTSRWIGMYGQGLMIEGQQIDWGTVYYMTWDAGLDRWELPRVALSQIEMYGQEQPLAEIDALSVYAPGDPANPSIVVFSLTAASGFLPEPNEPINQILVTQPSTQTRAMPLRTPASVGGVRMTRKMGLLEEGDNGPGSGPDEVNSGCGWDPREADVQDMLVGVPVNPVDGSMPFDAPLGLSLLRHDENPALQSDELLMQTHGIDASDYAFAFIGYEVQIIDPDAPTNILEAEVVGVSLLQDSEATSSYVHTLVFGSPPAGVERNARVYARIVGFDAKGNIVGIQSSWPSVLGL